MILTKKSEFGDFQTPSFFCDQIINLLSKKYKIDPSFLIEPTIGKGNFVLSAQKKFREIKCSFGLDLNKEYIHNLRKSKIENLRLEAGNAFVFPFSKLDFINTPGQLLCLGNPPWVTNSFLSKYDSDNLPLKSNKIKNNKGFSAISGSSNFDIAEYILSHLIEELGNRKNTFFAFLVKSIVARNIYKSIIEKKQPLAIFDTYSFNSKEIFNVSCDAVLLVFKFAETGEKIIDRANEFSLSDPGKEEKQFGFKQGVFVSNINSFKSNSPLLGKSQIIWRQGIKHDCSKIMELKLINGNLFNKNGDNCDFIRNSDRVFPLVKSSDLKGGIISNPNHFIIVTQDKVGQDTSFLKNEKFLWEYLNKYKKDFDNRKSIIYKRSPSFSIFGVGAYSFYKYKIAISGFYKKPRFTFLLGEKSPIMTDDTCYFIGTNNEHLAQLLFCSLNTPLVYSFLCSISFSDSKRPFTKAVLQKINLVEAIKSIGFAALVKETNKLFSTKITYGEFEKIITELNTENLG